MIKIIYKTCFHFLRLTMRDIAAMVTPNFADSSLRIHPFEERMRISLTFSSVNFTHGFFSPRRTDSGWILMPFLSPLGTIDGFFLNGCSSPRRIFSGWVFLPFLAPLASLSLCVADQLSAPRLIRPLASASCVLFLPVPGERCSGFQHGGLSQLCRIINLKSNGPLKTRYASLWTPMSSVGLILKAPYSPRHPCSHGQHSPGFPGVNLLIKRANTAPLISGKGLFLMYVKPSVQASIREAA